MIEALGARVLKLVRIRIGPISIGSLPIGKWRLLTRREIAAFAARKRTDGDGARPA
jgi:16S rRNA U516 pseudouridylate synthase RsuA-like enzyme